MMDHWRLSLRPWERLSRSRSNETSPGLSQRCCRRNEISATSQTAGQFSVPGRQRRQQEGQDIPGRWSRKAASKQVEKAKKAQAESSTELCRGTINFQRSVGCTGSSPCRQKIQEQTPERGSGPWNHSLHCAFCLGLELQACCPYAWSGLV